MYSNHKDMNGFSTLFFAINNEKDHVVGLIVVKVNVKFMYSKLGKYVSFTIDQYVINTRLTIYQFLSFHASKPSRRLVYIVSQNQYQIVKII